MSEELDENIIEARPITIEEVDEQIWITILSWLNSQSDLPENIRDLIAKRTEQLRLKMQVLFVEMQKKYLTEIALDVQFETELKREMRKSFPFLTPREQAEIFKSMSSTTEDRLRRLENQLQGFDLFANIEHAVQTLANPVPSTLQEKVKKLSPLRRQQLLSVIDNLKDQVQKIGDKPVEETK